jgi:ABC-type Fe3+-siderophore transport system permease subunit
MLTFVTLLLLLLLLSVIGLTPGGSSIHSQTVHRIQRTEHTQQLQGIKINYKEKNWEVRAVTRLRALYLGICLTIKEEARKNLS